MKNPGDENLDIPPAPSTQEEHEPAHYDDNVIGRAFRWSAVAMVVLALLLGCVILWINRKPARAAASLTELTAPSSRTMAKAEIPQARFTDITASSGIGFAHDNGAYGEKLLPETMGGGVAFLDYDNDGDQDLVFINSTSWPWRPAEGAPSTLALYRNDGTGRFEDVTAGSGLDVTIYGMGVAVGDFDNDGFADLFVSAVGENRLFRNQGDGTFIDVTAQAGLKGGSEEWSASSAWIDFDNDGLLDLFVCNYVRWSKEIDLEVGYKLIGVGRAYGPPTNFEGTFPYLYRNNGDGTFTDVSATSGVQMRNPATGVPAAKSLGVAPVDLNGDGWIDLVVANDTVQNFVFLNNRDGTFQEIGALTGIAFDSNGHTRGAMGIDSGRFRNDDALGLVIGNFANEMTALYVSQRTLSPAAPPLFLDEAIAEGIGPASRLLLKFGIFFFDYDLDGRLDVLSANGHLEEEINKVQ
jgi:enediyne biosynthesis protein E4